jgi:hypothetical protein
VRVFYGDGSVFDGEPEDAPKLNVQCVVTPDDSRPEYNVKWLVLHEWDFYLFSKGRWYGINGYADLVDHVIFERPDVVLKGRMIPNPVYQQILAEAKSFAKGKTVTSLVESGR